MEKIRPTTIKDIGDPNIKQLQIPQGIDWKSIEDYGYRRWFSQVEEEQWGKIIQSPFKITPAPVEVTNEMTDRLYDKNGFYVTSLPSFSIGTREELREKGVQKYLTDLGEREPILQRYETSSTTTKMGYGPANFKEWYWQTVHDGYIPFPDIETPKWVVIEACPKPETFLFKKPHYQNEHITHMLNLKNRTSSPDIINARIATQKKRILKELGLPLDKEVRLPQAHELLLLSHHRSEIFNHTNTAEMTSTIFHNRGKSYHLIFGSTDHGGRSDVRPLETSKINRKVGFRLMIIL